MENPEWVNKILELISKDVPNNNINSDGGDTNDN